MGILTNIEWCDDTLNLWWGCTKVSEGCKFCYAEHLADHRYNKGNWGPTGERKEVKSWRTTLSKISKRAKAEGRRRKVFVQSMSDTFEGPETMGGVDSENWTLIRRLCAELMEAIEAYPELDFLLLTKRPEKVMERIPIGWTADGLPPNLWIGTSVEDQKTADQRIPELLKIPAKVRFLSCEPLLGEVNLTCIRNQPHTRGKGEEWTNAFTGVTSYEDDGGGGAYYSETGIDWVIVGGESGLNARPMHPDWARSLRDQCQSAGVPFFFKQWGEWAPGEVVADYMPIGLNGAFVDYNSGEFTTEVIGANDELHIDDEPDTYRIGKKRAGRTLDGREWNEFPLEVEG